MAKRSPPPAPKPTTTVTSDIPLGGKVQNKLAERPEPEIIEWNSEGDEVPPQSDEIVGAPVPHGKDEARDERIRKLLHGDEATVVTESATPPVETPSTDETPPAEVEAKAEGETEEGGDEKPPTDTKPKDEAKPPAKEPTRRKDILANLATERARRQLETRLKEAGEAKNAAEARAKVLEDTLKSQSIGKLAKMRGLTREQAMEELIMKDDFEETETPAGAPADPKPAANDPEKDDLKRRVNALETAERAKVEQQATAIVQTILTPLDLPLVKASKRIPVPLVDQNGKQYVEFRTKEQVILQIAEERWIAEGRPQHIPRVDYLGPAAETLEEHLAEEHADMLAAHAARIGKSQANTTTETPTNRPTNGTKSEPALGKRMTGGAAKPTGDGLSMDRDERQQQIKARFGLK